MDVGAKSEIHKIIRSLAREGLAVLMISSDLPEILGMSDRIAVMRAGTITAMLPGKSSAHDVMAAALGQKGQGRNDKDISANSLSPARLGATDCCSSPLPRPHFINPQPLLSLLAREAPTLVVACGMALVIICRQIDISVGSQFAVCSVCAGLLAAMKWPLALVLPASIAVGALLGAINGVLVAGLRLPSIVVTLATMVTWREGLRWLRQGEFVTCPTTSNGSASASAPANGRSSSSPSRSWCSWRSAMKHLAAGRFVYAVGSDAEAARLAGIRPQLITFATFMLIGALTGLAAMMNIVQSPQVDPKSGTGLELKTIAAVVVGGVAISGGRGNLWGVFAGLLLLACISPALTHLHIEAYWEKAIQGAIILLAVVADGLRSRKARKS